MAELIVDEVQSIATDESKTKASGSFFDIFRIRDFRLLWIGETISLLGDQFYLIALPWLALQLTGSALALGTVMAVAGIPRALFMLVGGAFTDRFSPRTIMLGSNLLRAILVGVLTVLVLTGAMQFWMLYVFALIFGLVDAFFFPATSTIVPRLVTRDRLEAANALIQGTAHLSLFVGPMLAGVLIALFGAGADAAAAESVPDITGIGLAFGFDTLTFLFSIIALWLMRPQKNKAVTDGQPEAESSVIASIKAGLRYAWNDPVLRLLLVAIAAIDFLFAGTVTVGIPVLADTRFPEGAAAFGIIFAMFGGGALVGTILAGVLPRPPARHFGRMIFGLIGIEGLLLALLGFAPTTALAAILVLAMGMSNGYINILAITWLQKRTDEQMLGRMMSLVMFASLGLQPLSNALAGVVVEIDIVAMFVVAGVLLAGISWISAISPTARTIGVEQAEIVGQ